MAETELKELKVLIVQNVLGCWCWSADVLKVRRHRSTRQHSGTSTTAPSARQHPQHRHDPLWPR